jgi:Tfp pilus assembly major pilin PilA
MNYEDESKTFNDEFASMVEAMPDAYLVADKSESKGTMMISQGAPVYYEYDETQQRLIFISGMGASITSLENAAATIQPNKKHEMLKLEQDIDSSHEGLFAWVSPEKAMPYMQMGMPPEKLQQLKELGVDQAKGLAVGYGVSGGKTRLKLLVDMPDVGVRQFLPVANNDFNIKSVGEPKSVFVMSWFTAEQVDQFIEKMETVQPGFKNDWEDFAANFKQESGMDFDILLKAFGPEIIRINDDVGAYWVIKHDKKLFSSVIESYKKVEMTEYSKTEKDGLTIHHIKSPMIPFDFSTMSPREGSLGEGSPGEGNVGFELAQNMKSHMYFSVEGDHIIYSTVPQILIERYNRGADTDISSWMKEQQGFEFSHSLLGYTTSVEDISRTSYHYYLELLNQLNDVSQADIDLMMLPTAGELGFPDEGAIGVSLISGKDRFGLEFTFENGATDIMVGAGGATTVAVIGILAAVAVPAYQDYTVRAQMTSGVYAAETLKLQIAESLAAGAKVEDIDNGFEGIKQPQGYATSVIEKMVVNDGVITVFFRNTSLGYGPQTIVYVPMFDGQRITYWDCTGGTVAKKYRPARCK